MNKILLYVAIVTIVLFGLLFVASTYVDEGEQPDLVVDESSETIAYDTVVDPVLGISFAYKTAPNRYIVDDVTSSVREESQGMEVVKALRIMNAREKHELENSEGGREGPPTIQLTVFENAKKQSANMWIDAHSNLSNIELLVGSIDRDAVVAGANAVRYKTDGLYQNENVVIAHGRYIYHFTGSFLEAESQIYKDFQRLIDSVTFIPADTEIKSKPIIVNAPKDGQVVASPLMLSGSARGFWFFEATAPVVVVDWDGRIVGESYIEATGEWMTEEFVPFEGTISFTLPDDSYSASGTLIFQRANPSGLPEHDQAVEVPVKFQM